MTFWCVVFVVLMMFWLFGVGYWNWDKGPPHVIGNVLIPWLCVLILGLVVFGALDGRPAVVVPAR